MGNGSSALRRSHRHIEVRQGFEEIITGLLHGSTLCFRRGVCHSGGAKACLMSRKDHPTADALYTSIREQFPNISLGTVYRNLNLLVELGEIRKLSCGDGTDHFDYDTSPHYHYVCRQCGRVMDIPMEATKELETAAKEFVLGTIDDHTVFFYGICDECLKGEKH